MGRQKFEEQIRRDLPYHLRNLGEATVGFWAQVKGVYTGLPADNSELPQKPELDTLAVADDLTGIRQAFRDTLRLASVTKIHDDQNRGSFE